MIFTFKLYKSKILLKSCHNTINLNKSFLNHFSLLKDEFDKNRILHFSCDEISTC